MVFMLESFEDNGKFGDYNLIFGRFIILGNMFVELKKFSTETYIQLQIPEYLTFSFKMLRGLIKVFFAEF